MIQYRRDLYLACMNELWRRFENVSTPKLELAWDRIGEIFARPNRFDLDLPTPPVRAVPAATGVGKSTAMQVFSVLHAEQTNFLVGLREIAECDGLARELRKLAVRCFRSGLTDRLVTVGVWHSEEKDFGAFSADILLVTHEGLRRSAVESERFSRYNFGTSEHPTSYKPDFAKADRPGRRWIVDETLRLSDDCKLEVAQLRVMSDRLSRLIESPGILDDCVERAGVVAEELMADVQAFGKSVEAICTWGDGAETASDFRDGFLGATQLESLKQLLDHPDANDILCQASAEGIKEVDSLVDSVIFIANNWAIRCKEGAHRNLVTARSLFPAEAPCLCILDATAHHSSNLLSLVGTAAIEQNLHLCAAEDSPRDYSKVRLYPFIIGREGKDYLGDSEAKGGLPKEAIARAIVEAGRDDREAGVLVLGRKDLRRKIESVSRLGELPEYTTGHYGKHDRGTNEFSTFSGVVLVGPYRLPTAVYQAQVLAMSGANQRNFVEAQQQARKYQQMDMVASTIQATNRVRMRRTVGEGACEPTTVCLLVTAETWALLREPIALAMPGIRFMPANTEWSEVPAGSPHARKNNKVAERVHCVAEAIRGLQLSPGESRTLDSIMDGLGIDKDRTRRTLKQRAQEVCGPVADALRASGLVLTNPGRGRQPLSVSRVQ